MTADRCHVEVLDQQDGVRVVVMTGEFDLDNAGPLRLALDPQAEGVRRFVVDVTEVSFADSITLTILLQATLARDVVLAGSQPSHIAQLLRLTGADRVFAAAPSVAEGRTMILPPRAAR
ncbi:STAS domain-containing protein [Streptomyces sp. NPDC058622]|uniref:STAS domain-containing protein n=1 Tax=Streptomyces sp. NPDC058622 TaxID=3346562 RepID=UPI0036617251